MIGGVWQISRTGKKFHYFDLASGRALCRRVRLVQLDVDRGNGGAPYNCRCCDRRFAKIISDELNPSTKGELQQ